MRGIRWGLGVTQLSVVTLAVTAGSIGAQAPSDPPTLWRLAAGDERDTVLHLPAGIAVDHTRRIGYIADVSLPGVVILDLDRGLPIRLLAGKGNGPGEFNNPLDVAVSPDGHIIAVYDVGRRTVDLLRPDGSQIRRIPTGGFAFLKAMSVGNDGTVLLSGATGAGGPLTSITWVTPDATVNTGPVPAGLTHVDEGTAQQALLYAAGGPVHAAGDSAIMVEGTSADLYFVGRFGTRRIARGFGTPPDLLQQILRPGPRHRGGDGPIQLTVSFNFPRAIWVEPISGGYRALWSVQDSSIVRQVEYRQGAPARVTAAWRMTAARVARVDARSFLVLAHTGNGWALSRQVLTP